jgi:DNA gyrase subunit A
MRYTEIRMSKIANEMIADLEKETVDTVPNYDNTEEIPVVLPNKFPNLLVNGSSGIAVGMATNIPPHNLTEVINATLALIQDPNITVDGLMEHLPAPDFPTGGLIYGLEGVREAYSTGNGKVVMRAKVHFEEESEGKSAIVIDEIPYNVSKKRLVEKISECMRDKTIEGITEINDYSGKDHDVRVVIRLRRGEVPEIVLNKLYKHTQMQSSFAINMLALVDNHPEVLTLKQILEHFVKHRREIVTRRTVFDLKKCRDRAHRLEGFAVALKNIEEVIQVIRSSANRPEAKERLMAKGWDYGQLDTLIERAADGTELCKPETIGAQYGCRDGLYYLSSPQVEAILDMQLHRLTGLEYEKIVTEYNELVVSIKEYLHILTSEERLLEVICEELVYVRDTYGDERRSEIKGVSVAISKADLIEPQTAVITLSQAGYIKYQPAEEFDEQHRGGRGRKAAKMKGEDAVHSFYIANTHDNILLITSNGKAFKLKTYDLPAASFNTKGLPIVNLIQLQNDETVQNIIAINDFEEDKYLVIATKNGLVKKLAFKHLRFLNAAGKRVISLLEGDEVVDTAISNGDDLISLFSSDGQCITFNEFYPLSAGSDDDSDEDSDDEVDVEVEENINELDNADTEELILEEEVVENETITIEELKARFKPTKSSGIRPQGRTSRGVRGIKLRKGAQLVSMVVIDPNIPHYVIACENGYGKRSRVTDFRITRKGSQGVRSINTGERNGNVIGATQVLPEDSLMLITNNGVLIRTRVSEISVIGRSGAGVKVINLDEGSKLVGLRKFTPTQKTQNEDEVVSDGEDIQQNDSVTVESNEPVISQDLVEQTVTEDITE